MCPNTDVEMTDSSDSTKKKPLLIYIISVMYLWSGLKGLFAGLWGPFMMWFISIEELKPELLKQPNYNETYTVNQAARGNHNRQIYIFDIRWDNPNFSSILPI